MVCLLVLGALLPVVLGWSRPAHHGSAVAGDHRPPSNERTSLTFLYQNNLNASDDAYHVGAILLDPMGQHDIREACEEIGETLITRQTIDDHKDDFRSLFAYLTYSGRANTTASYYIRDGVLSVAQGAENFDFLSFPRRSFQFPVLCTQTSTGSITHDTATTHVGPKEVRVSAESNMYIGIRDRKSFRFLGIPYADRPQRFVYSTPYSRRSETIYATEYGPNCAQPGGGSEDCLFLNIHTPYIPKRGMTQNLKPVLFWIHGGGFTSGTGADPLTDGGNLASREDIVVVTINYRLSTLGFLAIPGTDIRGNFGLGDQVVALEWTRNNIAQFGGDPNRITIMGESAGAASVRALLGSSPADGLFHAAIAMSTMGGGDALGLSSSDPTTYSSYMTIRESYDLAGQHIVSAAGCSTGDLEDQTSCLEQVPASSLVGFDAVARHIVQDGHYVTEREMDLIEKKRNSSIPVMFGTTADEGAPMAKYPEAPVSNLREGIQIALGIGESQAQSIIDSGLFPSDESGNVTLDSFDIAQRVATDLYFRCVNQAAMFAGVASGVFQPSFYYQIETTTADYYPEHQGAHAATSEFPHGDADLPYFRIHGSDLPWIFGTLEPLRDGMDLDTVQLLSAYFAEFVRSGQPNPSAEYLEARRYQSTLDAVTQFDRWEPVSHSEGPIQLLSYPSFSGPFQDLKQCEFLQYPITYYFH
ncbi:Alpha/Beta hydrolase protein [Aspergillus ambiguus]|uniref:putative carboxylesterase n=1 Tax=Aspergillus ambiguus TaxID=176160 RepID=UPI003CCDE58A